MLIRREGLVNQRLVNGFCFLRLMHRGLGRFDMSDQMDFIIFTSLAQVHLVTGPGGFESAPKPRLKIIWGLDAFSRLE